jgi:Domain of unknown function (DUF4263)
MSLARGQAGVACWQQKILLEEKLFVPIDEALIKKYELMLEAGPPPGHQKEQVVQSFLEDNSELIPTPNLLNHHLHYGCVVSKFPLSTELLTDYLYVTKSSDLWRVTLVELETPEKRIFTGESRRANTTAEFNAALNQVRSWKHSLDDWKDGALRNLEPLLRPKNMQQNPIEFQYQLIIGRSKDKNRSALTKRHMRGLMSESGIDILTYDTVLNWYRHNQRYKKNVLRLVGRQYEFKRMHIEPDRLLSYVGVDFLKLNASELDLFRARGYEIDKWLDGSLLVVNGKYARTA